jgi:hypothetical protein
MLDPELQIHDAPAPMGDILSSQAATKKIYSRSVLLSVGCAAASHWCHEVDRSTAVSGL